LLGASNEQISQLISTGKASASFGVYSPVEGYVTSSNENSIDQNEFDIREGMYVTAGQLIFTVANPKRVWAEFDLYSNEAELVRVGDPVRIEFHEAKKEVEAHLNFIQPFYKGEEHFTKVRVYLSNERGDYRIGQLASAAFNKPSQYSMWIPLSAQLDLGTTKITFLKKGGVFQPQKIITGSQSGKWIEVLNGIETTDSIAYNAHFMIDSESFIKIKK
jgi:Cu(I)/Ag(I) efflux system membrane fusion protein